MPTMMKTIIFTIFLTISTNAQSNTNLLRGSNILGDKRRLGLIPASKAIEVLCHNSTSNCGMHGVCRISGPHKYCHCDSGYSSFTKEAPCAEKGKTQLVLAIMQYMFGYTGGPAFALGWIALGLSTIIMCCCGCCCYAQGSESKTYSDGTRASMLCFGIICMLISFGLWIYTAVKISTDCVDKDGTPCKSWRRLNEYAEWEIDS
jgi:hypothetical protein